ncbi:DUF1467 family protein [Pseudaminobacter arsenicus]|uniref:DUF1467 family protein n=1 Tax=Borborobacter arsenicus TaxID=1851146 RepID=A0A432VBY9_9HYPH|nr:DUF1467 family protein [Pseudaminobacter arsenicus]RUM99680.1 DUF1467 family protein [Pseudaminobacter arsenicus]
MSWVSGAAVFFIIWWTVLFAALPFGLKTQDDSEDVTLGTVSSAPGRPHMLKAVIRTTIISLIIFGGLYYVTRVLGLGFDDIPIVIPQVD